MEYNMQNMRGVIQSNISSPSIELVHSVIDSIYEYADYTELNNDIILISVKKN